MSCEDLSVNFKLYDKAAGGNILIVIESWAQSRASTLKIHSWPARLEVLTDGDKPKTSNYIFSFSFSPPCLFLDNYATHEPVWNWASHLILHSLSIAEEDAIWST
jgi:hypothetical protein